MTDIATQTSGNDETTNVETSGNHETPTNQASDTEETLLKQATGNDDPAPEETSGNEETQPKVTDVSDETSPQEGSRSDGTPPEWLMYAHPVFHQLLAGFYASRKITVAESMVTYKKLKKATDGNPPHPTHCVNMPRNGSFLVSCSS